MVQMFGWFSAEAARASRSNRSSAWRSLRQSRRQELERDEAAELRVLGLVDDAHAAAADLLQDAVVGNGVSCLHASLSRVGVICQGTCGAYAPEDAEVKARTTRTTRTIYSCRSASIGSRSNSASTNSSLAEYHLRPK